MSKVASNSLMPKERLTPFRNFVKAESTAGVCLLAFAVIAIILANSPYSYLLSKFWSTELNFSFGSLKVAMPLSSFINESLMTFFFLVVGLEIKRELVVGELSSLKKAILPVVAAFGGVLVPSLLFLAFNHGNEFSNGWAIPTSTDIAFCLAVLHLLGRRIPVGLKVFTAASAIVDDLFGVIILAIFYSHGLSLLYLGACLIPLGILYAFNKTNVRSPLGYLSIGLALWIGLLGAGIHASVAGVILAMFVPVKPTMNPENYHQHISDLIVKFKEAGQERDNYLINRDRKAAILEIESASVKVQSPLQRLESGTHPWVAFLILPLFALCNAGISFSVIHKVTEHMDLFLGIFIGLVFGKLIGISLFSYIAVKSKIAALPNNVNFGQIFSVASLSGIGFTMSLFIASLAYEHNTSLDVARFSILLSSVVACGLGLSALLYSTRKRSKQNQVRFTPTKEVTSFGINKLQEGSKC